MKKLLLLISLVACLVSMPACKSPEMGAYATVNAIVKTANTWMDDWNTKVGESNAAVARGEQPTVTLDDERKVKRAWEAYQKANLGAEASLRALKAAREAGEDDASLKEKLEAAVKSLKDMADELESVIGGLL